MRIGVLTTSFPRHDGDAAGAFVLGFSRALAERGHSIEVLAPEPNEGSVAPSWPGVGVEWVPYMRPRAYERTFYGAGVPDNLARSAWAWVGLAPFVLALGRAVRARVGRWDAIASHWALPCALVAGAARAGRPHLAVLHSADVHLLAALPLRRAIASRVVDGATSLLFASPPLRDAFLSCMGADRRTEVTARSHVSPMGIEPCDAPIDRAESRLRWKLGRFTVLSMGRLVPIKGVDVAIRAVGIARSRGVDVDLVVAGDGPERERLERLASRLGASARFVGTVSGEAKRSLLAAADVFVAPSRVLASGRTEGTPTAVLEAMAAGLPVIASDVGGLPFVVHDERTGLLVPPDRPRVIIEQVLRLSGDDALRERLGRAASREAERYAWSAIGPELERCLTGERRGRCEADAIGTPSRAPQQTSYC